MQAHVAYCGELLRAGKALVFGPVADPAGSWGLGVLQLPDDADPQDIIGQRSRREGRCRLHLPGDAAGSHNSRGQGQAWQAACPDCQHSPCRAH